MCVWVWRYFIFSLRKRYITFIRFAKRFLPKTLRTTGVEQRLAHQGPLGKTLPTPQIILCDLQVRMRGKKNQKKNHTLCHLKITRSSNLSVSWEPSHTHSFTYCLRLLLCCKGRVEWLWQRRACGSQSLKYLLSSSLLKKFSEAWFRKLTSKSSISCLAFHSCIPFASIYSLSDLFTFLCSHVLPLSIGHNAEKLD